MLGDKPSARADKADAATLNATLSYVNGIRTIAVLEKAIERLQLLSLLNYDAFPNSNDQYVEIQGLEDSPSGVGNILEEQKRLEHRYEELLILLSKQKANLMDPQLDPVCYSNVDNVLERQQKEELQAISAQLKEFSKQLTRQLKENPNDSDNWKKVLNERNELTNMLSVAVRELSNSVSNIMNGHHLPQQTSGSQVMHFDTTSQKSGESMTSFGAGAKTEASYEIFAKKVVDEQNEKIWADEIVKREKETNMNVKTLQNEVTQERMLKEKEIEERQLKLSELKTKVRKLKAEAKQQSEKRKADSEAHAEARARQAKDRQRHLHERIERLEKKLEIENDVFGSTEKHLNKKSAQLATKTAEWTHRQVEENKELDDKLMNEKRRREDQVERLLAAEERHEIESERKRDREDGDQKKIQDKKRWEDLQRSEYAAATKLQCSFKAFLVRKQTQEMKKKGKKGGKKK